MDDPIIHGVRFKLQCSECCKSLELVKHIYDPIEQVLEPGAPQGCCLVEIAPCQHCLREAEANAEADGYNRSMDEASDY